MIVDPRTYSKSVNHCLHTETKKTVMDFAAESGAAPGAILDTAGHAQVSESGVIKAQDMTYGKPEKESALDALQKNCGQPEEQHKNEVVVMSQTTSPEDYAKIQEEGFSVIDSDTHTVVTVMDKIKVVLAKSGNTAMGDLTREQLEEITGSVAMASQISNLIDDAKAYLLKNSLKPTVDNLYKANFSSDNMQRVFLSEEDFQQISTQLQDILEQANISVDNTTMEEAKWLITYQIPVTGDNLKYLEALNRFSDEIKETPLDENTLTERIAGAVVNGHGARNAVLLEGFSIEDQAVETLKKMEEIDENALCRCIQSGRELTIDNLYHAAKEPFAGNVDEARLATARRQLEEVRLYMTAEANRTLLKKGISIDTQPIEELLGELKEIENSYYGTLLESEGVENSSENRDRLCTSMEYVQEMKGAPAYILDKMRITDSLEDFHHEAVQSRMALDKAGERYETLMTAPRGDMGDSIQKAFRNVDDILQDLKLDTSESNRRAVRILAYNHTALTLENIERVKVVDEQVQHAFKNLTPKVTLEMIRNGRNPLEMSMEELNQAASDIKQNLGTDEVERFSKFLFRLDQQKAISREERDSYIGIYRLIAQVEKTDGAVIGSLMNQGADITMKNLLSAVRSGKKSGMDYSIDDSFGGVAKVGSGKTIDSQILANFQKQCGEDALNLLDPAMKALDFSAMKDMTLEEVKAYLENQLSDVSQEQNRSFEETQLKQVKEALKAPQEVYSILEKSDMPCSVTNILAQTRMLENNNEMLRRLFKEDSNTEKIEELKDEVLSRFGEAVKTPVELAEAQETLAQVAEDAMKNMIIEDPSVRAIDVREMKVVTAGLKLAAKQTRDESFLVPIETSEGICGVAVRIVRDKENKGTVDITFNGDYAGKVAATFEAKEDHISGMIVVSDETTKNQISEQLGLLAGMMNEGLTQEEREPIDLKVVQIPDLSIEKYKLHSLSKESTGSKENHVQTRRLYHIAESFIGTLRELLS